MSFVAPVFLVGALALAALVVALHFLARREPRPAPLPTARFVPQHPARAPAPARRPTDPLLLSLRGGAIVLVGAALARPVFETRRPLARIAILDESATADRLPQSADSVVPAGGLSEGLVRALRAAVALAPGVDSIELLIASPLVDGSVDAATLELREHWRGRARLVRTAVPVTEPAGVEAVLDPDDPLRATIGLAGLSPSPEGPHLLSPSPSGPHPLSPSPFGRGGTSPGVRLVRSSPTPADSAWARQPGHTLVYWPADLAGWLAGDTAGAVTAGRTTVVHPFPRAIPPAGRPIAWWHDGTAAATEQPYGAGCVRTVAVDLSAGDLALRPGAQRLAGELLAACGGPSRLTPLPDSVLHALERPGPLLDARSLPRQRAPRVPANAALLAAALVALVVEQAVRRRVAP